MTGDSLLEPGSLGFTIRVYRLRFTRHLSGYEQDDLRKNHHPRNPV
jgi:hypothetical protein